MHCLSIAQPLAIYIWDLTEGPNVFFADAGLDLDNERPQASSIFSTKNR